MRAAKQIKKAIGVSALLAAFACAAASPALAEEQDETNGFGIVAFDGEVIADPQGTAFSQAGGHPYEIGNSFRFTRHTHPAYGKDWPEEPVKDIITELPPGVIGNAAGLPRCKFDELAIASNSACPVGSQVGNAAVKSNELVGSAVLSDHAIYNMVHPPGAPARFGINFFGTIVAIDASLRSEGDYGVTLASLNTSEGLAIDEIQITFWGVPADPRHDPLRTCEVDSIPGNDYPPPGCSSDQPEEAFVTLPTACTAPGEGLTTTMHANSWFHPGEFDTRSFESHLPPGFKSIPKAEFAAPGSPFLDPTSPFFLRSPMLPPLPEDQWGDPQGPSGCEEVLFEPSFSLTPSANSAEAATGVSVELSMPDEGLLEPGFLAQSTLDKAVVTLPEGVTVNPSSAEGLGYCTPSQYKAETVDSKLGEGCPAESRIGSVQIDSPLIEEDALGSLFIAQQDDPSTPTPKAENPFDSNLAIYVVAKDPAEGILVKLEGKVEPDERTGQLRTTFDDLPQLPFSNFELKFREGQRGVLISPPACGTYETEAKLYPHSDPDNPKTITSEFTLNRGVAGGSCAGDPTPPFNPSYSAGSLNNNAKSYSPFIMRLQRKDGDQDMTKFSSILPPGVLGKLAGVSKCPEAAIAAAEADTHTGRDEIANPSCPASSKIGRTLVGAGVGEALTYVPGSLYLAGPYKGDPLSVVAITPGVAGPFDVGTVLVREALTLNPVTAEVEVDGSASDPIPHILIGIPLKVRDLRVYVDREKFILNPTSCDPSSAKATLFGGFLDVFSAQDDVPVALSDRYQAANCANLGFKPKLRIKLKGGTRRGAHPALRAVLKAREPDANVGAAVVTLPKSAFLDQGHIRTICTRVQYAAGEGNGAQCPKGSIYGYARAFTPLLDEPVQGPVYLRSSNHKLPDLVASLHGLVDVDIVGRIDSFRGGIRSSFESVPDAPVSRFVLTMQGGRKGLVVNSRNLCKGTNRAKARFVGQNGKLHSFRPVVGAPCGGKR